MLSLIVTLCFGAAAAPPVLSTIKFSFADTGMTYQCLINPSGTLCAREMRITTAGVSQTPTIASYCAFTETEWHALPELEKEQLRRLNQAVLDARDHYERAQAGGNSLAYQTALADLASKASLLDPGWNQYREFITGANRTNPPEEVEPLPHVISLFAGAWETCLTALKGAAVVVSVGTCRGMACVVNAAGEEDVLESVLSSAKWIAYFDRRGKLEQEVEGKRTIPAVGAYDEKNPPGPGNPYMFVHAPASTNQASSAATSAA